MTYSALRNQSSSLSCLALVCLWVTGCRHDPYELPEHLEIEVRGKDRRWTARYPGADGILLTADDFLSTGKVCVPVGTRVTLHLRSDDFVYMFSLPHENLDTIAVPDLEYDLELTASKAGIFKLEGGTMCGRPNTNHGTFAAMVEGDFLDWHGNATH